MTINAKASLIATIEKAEKLGSSLINTPAIPQPKAVRIAPIIPVLFNSDSFSRNL